ncbi:MAG: hypothetical protein AAF749_06095 [Pseudomonadota bacterium]
MCPEDELAIARREMIALIDNGRTTSRFSKKRPTHWSPYEVICPETGQVFTAFSCWSFVRQLLVDAHPMTVVRLDVPPGAKGFVMKVLGAEGCPEIYIKLQIGQGLLVGRSFHNSYPEN